MENRQSVLIVDSSEETREVLQTALERRGVQIFSASRARQGLKLARQHHPDVIVLDLEVKGGGADRLPARLAEQAPPDGQQRLVLLGSLRRGKAVPSGEFVAKPYHYGPLIRKIEELLKRSA